MNAIKLTVPFPKKMVNEFPDSIKETKALMQKLSAQIEHEADRDRRRELFLFIMELRDHVFRLDKANLHL